MQDEVEMRTEELARWTVERSKSLGADCASAEVSHGISSMTYVSGLNTDG